MNISTSIIILAGWLPVVAALLSSSVNTRGLGQAYLNAWLLTITAILIDTIFKFHLPIP